MAAGKSVTPVMDAVWSPPLKRCASLPSRCQTSVHSAAPRRLNKGWRERTVLERQPVLIEPTVYRLQRKSCPHSQQHLQSQAPGVLPQTRFGNHLLAEVLTSHDVHGEPRGRLSERRGLTVGSLIEMAHRTATLLRGVVAHLSAESRQTALRHADETGWRTDGHSGDAWLLCTAKTSLFLFRRSRSSAVAKEI